MPRLFASYSERYGLFGVTLALIGWLLCIALIVVASTAVATVLDRDQSSWARRIRRGLRIEPSRRATGRRPRRSGHDRRAARVDARPGSGRRTVEFEVRADAPDRPGEGLLPRSTGDEPAGAVAAALAPYAWRDPDRPDARAVRRRCRRPARRRRVPRRTCPGRTSGGSRAAGAGGRRRRAGRRPGLPRWTVSSGGGGRSTGCAADLLAWMDAWQAERDAHSPRVGRCAGLLEER